MYQFVSEFLLKYQMILVTIASCITGYCYATFYRDSRLLCMDPARYLQKNGFDAEQSEPSYVSRLRVESSKKKVADALATIRLSAKVSAEESVKLDQILAEQKIKREAEDQALQKLLTMKMTMDPTRLQMLLGDIAVNNDILYVVRVLEEAEKQHQIEEQVQRVPTFVPYPDASHATIYSKT